MTEEIKESPLTAEELAKTNPEVYMDVSSLPQAIVLGVEEIDELINIHMRRANELSMYRRTFSRW